MGCWYFLRTNLFDKIFLIKWQEAILQIPRNAMLLAAGFGSRMGQLTSNLPKSLLRVGGRAIIDYVVDHLVSVGVELIVVNLHHKGDVLREHLISRTDVKFLFSEEKEKLLGTGGGVARAIHLLGREPFYLVNGDAMWLDGREKSLLLLAQDFDRKSMDARLLLQSIDTAIAYEGIGDFHVNETARLQRRTGDKSAPFVFTGVQLISPGIFSIVPDVPFSMNYLYDAAMAAGRLFGTVHNGLWVELNTPAGVTAADLAIAS